MDINILFVGIVIIIIGTIRIIVTYNNIISIKNNVKETSSAVDVLLKKRFDLIPNLVAAVQWYTKHEAEMLKKLTKIRSNIMDDSHDKEKFDVENGLSNTLKSVFAVAENYPDLKANENFMLLQKQLETIEDKIQAARRGYNASVKELYDSKEQFPSKIIANRMNIPHYDMFEATIEEQKNIKVQI